MSGQRTKANDAKLDNLKRGGATPEMAAKARAANIRKSGAVMDNAMIYIERTRTAGCTTLQQLADALNQGAWREMASHIGLAGAASA